MAEVDLLKALQESLDRARLERDEKAEPPREDGEWEGDDLPTPDEALRMGWSV